MVAFFPGSFRTTWNDPHSFPHFFQISGKEAELAKGYADEKDCHGPDECYQYNIYNDPDGPGVNIEQVHDFFTEQAGKTAANGESAKDQDNLEAGGLPLFL